MTIRTVDEELVGSLRSAWKWCSGYEPSWSLLLKECDEAATLIEQLHNRVERLTEMVEILRVRECGTWCDPSLNEHTSYCTRARSGEHQLPTRDSDRGDER